VKWVHDETSTASWILGLMGHTLATLEVPLLSRLHAAWSAHDLAAVRRWSDFALAARGSHELQAEDRRMGAALARVLTTLELSDAAAWGDDARVTYVSMFALACARWSITPESGAQALLFAWAENQAAAAMRLVPLGQSAGLRILARVAAAIPEIVARGLGLPDDELGLGAPALVLASAHHETQYSRLFRS
jgi:urease accessory protein